MYIEAQYIREQFTANFAEGKPGNIVIYGTGIHTQRLLESIHIPQIAGLMDAKKTGETLWGYRVLSYDEVAALRPVYIVIIARNAVINVIYRRIEGFCMQNHIEVYDINGNNLCGRRQDGGKRECFCVNENAIKEAVGKSEVVTFDIFDTLLTRCVMRPRDIFLVMDAMNGHGNCGGGTGSSGTQGGSKVPAGKDFCFSEERIRAEDGFLPGENPDIYEIYGRLRENTGMSREEAENFLEMEITVEKRFLRRRDEMCRILDWAEASGKEVYLISDMYFPKIILEEILGGFHIGGYRDIFISCECRKSKQEGLFGHFLEQAAAEGKRCVHIGDDFYSDFVAPQEAGICPCRIYSPVEMFESSIYAECIPERCSLEENIALSCFALQAYGNPFRKCGGDGKLVVESAEEMARLFIAPVIFKYMLWMVQGIRANGHDVVVFPSRDGYLLMGIYRLITEKYGHMGLPEAVYFYTSRYAALTAAAVSKDDLRDIMRPECAQPAGAMMMSRFGMDIGDCRGDREDIVTVYAADILEKCRLARENYKKYISGTGITEHKSIAVLDFVAMGSVQGALQKLTGMGMTGYYFLRRYADTEYLRKLECNSLYEMAGDFQMDANIYRYYYFLETILTSYEPTFKGIGGNGEKIFYKESRDRGTIEELERIHGTILDYSDEFLELLPDIFQADSPVEVYDRLLGFFSADYSELKTDGMADFVNVDEFLGRTVEDINR